MTKGITFKQINKQVKVVKEIKKVGLSLGIIFSVEELKNYGLEYGDRINLDNAEIINKTIEV